MSPALLLRDGLPDLLPPMVRAPGVHVSTVIKYIAVQRGLLKANNSALSRTWASLGQAHEHAIREMYARRWPDRFIANPPEMCVDNIYMNLDMLDFHPREHIEQARREHEEAAARGEAARCATPDEVEAFLVAHGDPTRIVTEVKLAEMSSEHTPRDCRACNEPRCPRYWRYEAQMLGYMNAVGCRVGCLDAMHRMGNWRRGEDARGPANLPWLLGYEASEVEANWRMIVAHADEMRCEACDGSGIESTSTCAACAGKGVKPWALMEG